MPLEVNSMHRRGIRRMLLAVAFLSVLDLLLKLLAERYPPVQVATIRGAASLPFVIVPLLLQQRMKLLRVHRWELHLLRGVLAVALMIGFTQAVRALSMSNTYTLLMVSPLLVTALSVPILREHVSLGGWIAVTVGLIGALCVLRPSAQPVPLGPALLALGTAGCYALIYVLARFMVRTESPQGMVFWYLAAVAIGCGVLAAPVWQAMPRSDWLLVAGVGLSGAIGQQLLTQAFVLAPASLVAPFDYTALIWGALFDWLIWSTRAPAATIFGAVLIVGSGLYVMLRPGGGSQ
jgi:drug/metabolite transporter (DMT)-like permease